MTAPTALDQNQIEVTALDQNQIEVTAQDLPLHCPLPSVGLWNTHPRVFLDVVHTGQARCPYCGTSYVLSGPWPSGHH